MASCGWNSYPFIRPKIFEVVPIFEKQNVESLDWNPNERAITPFGRAIRLRDNAETMAKYKAAQAINKPKLDEWEKRLAELEAQAPEESEIWTPIRNAVESMAAFLGVETTEMVRLKKIELAKEQIGKAKKNAEKFLKVLQHPQRIADLEEWSRNPNHEAILEASRDPTPDEIYAKLRAHQVDAYKPPPEPEKATTASTPWNTPWSYPEPKKPWDEPPY